MAVLPRLERPELQRARHDVLPAGRRQHAPVHQRAADPAAEPHGKVPLFIDDWQPVPAQDAMEWAARRRRSASSTRSRTSRSAASSACAAASSRRHAGAAGLDRRRMRTDYEAHFLLQNLMLTAEALRLGGWVHGAPMIPYVWERDPRRAARPSASASTAPRPLSPLAAGARLPAELRRHRRRARGPVPAVRRPTWTRRSTRCSRRSSAPAGTPTATPRSSRRPTQQAPTRRAYLDEGHALDQRPSSTRRTSAATSYDTYGRFPAHSTRSTRPASGCSSRTSRSSTTTASSTPPNTLARRRTMRSGALLPRLERVVHADECLLQLRVVPHEHRPHVVVGDPVHPCCV